MRVLLQRVTEASITVDTQSIARIGPGLLALVGISGADAQAAHQVIREQRRWLVEKMLGLRLFADEHNAMNRSLLDVQGELLVVSQFTLVANLNKGKRPSFDAAAKPDLALPLFDAFVNHCRQCYPAVKTGRFGADMAVALINDGPVTFLLER